MEPLFGSLLASVVMLALSAVSFAQIGVSITIGPPPLPVYEQPPCPTEGYIWTPGYWAYDYDYGDYYWVPGTWVTVPEVGLLWTPGYWGWGGESFVFYEGYWGPRVGFYGGINYGYGYFGEGYEGGRWDEGRFFYNRSVNNVNITEIHNVYNTTVNRVSYNGGNGGIERRPTPQEEAVAHERHVPPVAVQTQDVQAARANPQLRASVNQGKPPVAATPKPGAFSDRAVVPAKEAGGPYTPPANRGANHLRDNASAPRPENNVPRPNTAVHPNDLPPAARPSAPDTGKPSWTRSTSNSRKSNSRSRSRNDRNSSRSRSRSTSAWRNRTLMKRESSRSSSNTSNRRSNCGKNMHSSSRRCRRDSRQRPRISPSLRRRSLNRSLKAHGTGIG